MSESDIKDPKAKTGLYAVEKEVYYDETGKVIEDGDLLQVFHFIGARRKRFYIYKLAVKIDGIWYGKAVQGEDHKYPLWVVCNKETGIIKGTKIINKHYK